MKDLIKKPESLSKLEFWAATTIYVFSVFLLITPAVNNEHSVVFTPNKPLFDEANIYFNYYKNYFIPQLIQYTTFYLAFMALNFSIMPMFLSKKELAKNILFVVFVFLICSIILGTTDTYLKNYLFAQYETEQDTYVALFQQNFLYTFWLLLLFGFYTFIKYTGVYLLAHSEAIQSQYKIITQDALAAFVLWMVSMFLLMIGDAEVEFIITWGILIPLAILLYCYSIYSLIPSSLTAKKPFVSYVKKSIFALILSLIPVFLSALLLTKSLDGALIISLINIPFQLLITVPFSWYLFKRQMKGKEDVYVLQKELGQSNANFDFLRSQINPHFLFNALNTIYGTAIQEKAERTCEGIEKLGDMMRFMLQENMQEKISLSREVDYLNNYISLQKLRTDPNPIVKIDSRIEPQGNGVQIPPMLLIPFVENAFKHGISFREPSHIKISLEVREHTLYFDVNNSKHLKQENDPEKTKNGIGLSNVKQRLQLLYPAKHDLIIHETGKEFFVHLTMQLS
ncbi:histidine kinase [Rhodocytophaga aerolata]|uniref:Histidine kinase n=1 Tax=Rhodocytophaga aerolata TaxID=455078 RepID=A0ABT8RC87_9BACT|nr:histidine kinase [Rhodocytophaga aerolata]MDO1448944.1 histidine kinase [Rhodocytophaga aerolata]